MSESVLVYKGKEIAAYGFGDSHPFGIDRHGVFHAELEKEGLADIVDFGHPRAALIDELALFHTPEYIDKVSRMSAVGKGWLDDGDTPAVKGIYDAAAAVVGAVLCAVDEVMHGNHKRAFVPIAPCGA
jgi:acetoin utilization protein AcuC